MRGTRVKNHNELFNGPPGAYLKVQVDGEEAWLAKCPNGDVLGHIGLPGPDGTRHFVEEHEDGTITARPAPPQEPENSNSILCPTCGWHGFIDHGEWWEV